MKAIKYLNWEASFLKRIFQIRKQEFKYLTIFKVIDALAGILWECTPMLIIFVSIVYYAKDSVALNPLL